MITIFVAKLDFGVTENELFELFKQYGTVAKATIAKDRETNNSRGFAFVEMPDRDEAQKAIDALDGYSFNGRKCTIKEAENREGNKPDSNRGDQSFKPRSTSSDRDQRPSRPAISGDDNDDLPIPLGKDDDFSPKEKLPTIKKKKEVEKVKPYDNTADGKVKKQKMNAYKKSGKDTIQFENDDLDEEIDLFGKEENDDEDYKKYLINHSDEEEEDEEWDDDELEDEEWDEDDEWEDDSEED